MFHLLYDGLRGFYSELWKRELKSQSPKFTSSGKIELVTRLITIKAVI